MKLECTKDKLRAAISAADRLTGKNLSLAALSRVFLQAGDNLLMVRATNLDLGLELQLSAKVSKPGSVLVNSAVVNNFLNNLPGGELVKLEVVGNNLTIESEQSSSVIKAYPPDDFPTIPRLKPEASLTLPAASLVVGFRATTYAASLSDIKPEIASVYLAYDEERRQLCFAATDSFRLAEKRLTPPADVTPYHLIIPLKNSLEIIRLFERETGELTMSYTKNQVSFAAPGVYLTSRLVEGVFPDYRQIIPTRALTSAVVLKADLQGALKLSNVFSDKLNQVNIRVIPADNIFEITSKNSDVGESTTRLPAAIQGEEVDISFNVKYLLDCLSATPNDSVHLQFNGKTKPIMISGVGDPSFLYLIMPLNR